MDRLELSQVAGRMADQMELINLYTPVGALPSGNLEAHVILDGLYPNRGVPLVFEFGPSSEVTSING